MSAPQYKVLIADGLSSKGIEIMSTSGFQVDNKPGLKEADLLAIIGDYHALIVRSQTKVNATVLQAGKNLKLVGRAGVGVDNVDVDAATARGIIVMNTPGGNTISTAELTFSMMMALSRNIPQAHMSMAAGKWDRKSFQGVELYGKVLGIVGMGRIGSEVARRAIAFGMRVLSYDPFLSMSRAKSMQVELIEKLPDLLKEADYITIHSPLTAETKDLLNAETLKLTKKGVRIINCARGGLINESALYDLLKSGHIAGAALDVYEEEPPSTLPFRELSNVVLTPHLGASTVEAQESVGIEIAEQINDALLNGTIRNAVNMPNVDAKTLAILGPHLDLADKLGRLLASIAPKRAEFLKISYWGKPYDQDVNPITRTVIKGFLMNAEGSEINQVNALSLAANLGVKVEVTKHSDQIDFVELMQVTARAGTEEVSLSGTLFANRPRIVRINGKTVEAEPKGVLLLMENTDRPGIVGWLGTLMGRYKVNIANMSLSRTEQGGRAMTVLNLDSMPSPELLDEIAKEKDIFNVKVAKI
ncbi:MAG: phosphoglycerate dehydrogenase [Verrucomicrobiota bacterium]|nr:phosphoglycerate dehydrogenase [Verrucomicrobiota bacterium]